MKPGKILAITSGGTIGSLLEHENISVNRGGESALTRKLRNLEEELGVSLDIYNAANASSSNFEPEDWIKFARIITEGHDSGIDRFLITHGTDTLHYTAAFLALQFALWPIKVCLTGAFFPNNHLRSDGAANLACALEAVTDERVQHGAYVCFPQSLGVTPAVAVMAPDYDETQYRTLYCQALSEEDAKLKAKAIADLVLKERIPFISTNQFTHAKSKVYFARLHPGMDMRIYAHIPMNSLLIIEGFHSGTGSTRDDAHTLLALRANRPDLTICLGSIPSPMVELPYEVSVILADRGIWVYRDIPPHILFVAGLVGKALDLTAQQTFARFESFRMYTS
jgi:glutamyl-tRNA(Gln) amidotransferase subunit D